MTQYDSFMTAAALYEIFRKRAARTSNARLTDELESRIPPRISPLS
jgi:hypothetical protein